MTRQPAAAAGRPGAQTGSEREGRGAGAHRYWTERAAEAGTEAGG